jgi:repressor LexA
MQQYNDRGDDVIKFVREYTEENGYPPGYREVADGCGFAGTSHASYWIRKEVERGRLTRKFKSPRTLRVVDGN